MIEALGSIVLLGRDPGAQRLVLGLARGPGRRTPRAGRSSRASSVARASPTRPSVSLWLRPISCSSASIWMMRVPGLKVTRARRLPTASTTSASWTWSRSGESRQKAAPSESVVVVADRALALGGLGHAGLQVLGDRGERVVRAREVHAAARVDQRRARGRAAARRRGRRRARPRRGGAPRRAAAARPRPRPPSSRAASRSRPGGAGRVLSWTHRLAHRGRDVRDLEHALAPLGDRARCSRAGR